MTDHSIPPTATSGTGSVAAINGHPIHPMLVPLVIGTYVAATGADIAFALSKDGFWARSTEWLLLATLGAATLAVIPGLIDLLSIPRARNLPAARMHALGNALFLIVASFNFAWRQPDPAAQHGITGLLLSLVGLGLLGVSGWLGGQLAYKHGIGVAKVIEANGSGPSLPNQVASASLTKKFWRKKPVTRRG